MLDHIGKQFVHGDIELLKHVFRYTVCRAQNGQLCCNLRQGSNVRRHSHRAPRRLRQET